MGELELMNFYSESRPSPALCFPFFVVWYNDKKKRRRKKLSPTGRRKKKKLPLDLYRWPRLGQRRILGSINKWLDRWCRRRSAHNRLYLRHILNVLFRSHSCRRWMTPPLSRWERYCSRKNHHHLWLQSDFQQTLLDFMIPFFQFSFCCKNNNKSVTTTWMVATYFDRDVRCWRWCKLGSDRSNALACSKDDPRPGRQTGSQQRTGTRRLRNDSHHPALCFASYFRRNKK